MERLAARVVDNHQSVPKLNGLHASRGPARARIVERPARVDVNSAKRGRAGMGEWQRRGGKENRKIKENRLRGTEGSGAHPKGRRGPTRPPGSVGGRVGGPSLRGCGSGWVLRGTGISPKKKDFVKWMVG